MEDLPSNTLEHGRVPLQSDWRKYAPCRFYSILDHPARVAVTAPVLTMTIPTKGAPLSSGIMQLGMVTEMPL
jgi:hypothetical protein